MGMNKCLTVLLNSLIWDKHAQPGGLFCLFLCIAGGMVYKQAPMRGVVKETQAISADDDEFKADISNNVPDLNQSFMKRIINFSRSDGWSCFSFEELKQLFVSLYLPIKLDLFASL